MLFAADVAFASDPFFQDFFFDVCANPTAELRDRCAETPNNTGDLSGNSESSLNPSQPLSSQTAALARARDKAGRASETMSQLRDASTDVLDSGGSTFGIGPFSLLVNGRASGFDQDRGADDAERGIEGDVWALELGVDYRLNDKTVVGGFLGYENTNADYDRDEAGVNFTPQSNSGGIDADSYSLTLFASHNFTDRLYVEGSLGYGFTDYSFERNVVFQESSRSIPQTDVRARADTDGDQYWASVSVGYNYYRDALSFGPYARLTYANSSVDDYTEKDLNDSGLQMRIDVDDRTSLTSSLGFAASYAIGMSWGVLVPQARAEWEHEFEDDAQKTNSVYVLDAGQNDLLLAGDDPDRNYFNLGVGVSAIFPNGWMGFLDYEGLAGYDDLSRYRVTAGLRVEL